MGVGAYMTWVNDDLTEFVELLNNEEKESEEKESEEKESETEKEKDQKIKEESASKSLIKLLALSALLENVDDHTSPQLEIHLPPPESID